MYGTVLIVVMTSFNSRFSFSVNVTTQSFKDALRRERISERQKLGDFHHHGEGSWKRPKLIDLPPPLVEIGCNR